MCSNKKAPLSLRPHHGMCLTYFQGKGYSGGFVRHMGEVQKLLKAGAEVRLTVGADTICSACPNLKDGVCTGADKVEAYDRAVLALCGLEEEAILPYADFSSAVQSKILSPCRRSAVCGDCQWNELCGG